jgi:hypothetical protein
MNMEQFESFEPIINHFNDNASWDGALFETYGNELEFVLTCDESCIWTLQDADDNDEGIETILCNGYHVVNRIGYIITKKPYFGEPVSIDINE